MMKPLFILICILNTATSCVLDVNQKKAVTPYLSTNVTLYCHCDNNDLNSWGLREVYRIRISKFTAKNLWDPVAVLTVTHPVVKTSLVDASTTGYIDKPNNTFLKIHFDVVSEETIGQFICEIDGYDENTDIKVVRTQPIIITEQSFSNADVLKVLIDLKKRESNDNEEVKMLKNSIVELYRVIGNITNGIESMRNDISQLQAVTLERQNTDNTMAMNVANLTNRVEKISQDIQTISVERKQTKNTISTAVEELTKQVNEINTYLDIEHTILEPNRTNPALVWPAGQYTMLKSDTGCPNSPTSSWQFSSIRVSTQPGSQNTDRSSKDLNLSGNVFKHIKNHNYVEMEMCSMVKDTNGPKFPKGSYCVQVYSYSGRYDDTSCPPGLYIGDTIYGRFDDGDMDKIVNLPGYDDFKEPTHTTVIYCCTSDGEANHPILLPHTNPFYLYRYGGQCQKVVGMDVSNQWIHLDTNNENRKDAHYENYPDDTINDEGFRVELCYYTPIN